MQADEAKSAMAYPLRAVWRTNSKRDNGSDIQFLISIPKKRLRHAVDRVKMRRRVREAYRLNLPDFDMPEGDKTDLALIYVANELKDYKTVEKAICRLLQKIKDEKSIAQGDCSADQSADPLL